MVGNVILYFSVLSAAFKLKVPLPPYLPPAEQSSSTLGEQENEPVLRTSLIVGDPGLGHYATGGHEAPRCETLAATAIFCVRLDDERCHSRAGLPGSYVARSVWGYWLNYY